MRRLACLVLLLSGCARQSPDSIYEKSKSLLDRGEWKPALADAEAGFRREPSWRFRLLKAEILLSNGQAPAAMETLQGAEPPDSEELRVRLAMHRGQAKYLMSDYAGAEADLTEARNAAHKLNLPILDAQIELRRGALLVRQGRTSSRRRASAVFFRSPPPAMTCIFKWTQWGT